MVYQPLLRCPIGFRVCVMKNCTYKSGKNSVEDVFQGSSIGKCVHTDINIYVRDGKYDLKSVSPNT